MKITISNQLFDVLETKEKITIADSFVLRQNKIGTGKGEAKLYVGQKNAEMRSFLGEAGIGMSCFLLKKDLLSYLEDTKIEYNNPQQNYRKKDSFPDFWNDRKAKIEGLPNKIEFEVAEQTQISGPRLYLNSSDSTYKLIRELSLPNLTYLSIVKVAAENGKISYYFRLFADYFGTKIHPKTIQIEIEEIENIQTSVEKWILSKARVGQGKFREQVLKLCPICPITLVTNENLLIASHIKPWAQASKIEKLDPYNGFMFTPTFDRLFDRGFLTFTDDKKSKLSPFLSNETYRKLGISDAMPFSKIPIRGRENYLEYHRNEIFLG